MTRWKAAAVHLGISVLLIGSIVIAIFVLWFPYGLFRVAGLNQLLLTMICVDVVAGPLLTCLVYKVGKPSLKFDLSVIALLQAGFLGYALHTAWISRPVFLMWAFDHMSLVFANEIEPEDLAKGKTPQTRSLSWTGPRLVAMVLPKDSAEKSKIFTAMIRSGTSVERLPMYYATYPSARAAILRQARTVAAWQAAKQGAGPGLAAAIESTGLPRQRVRVVPIESSRDASVMLIDAVTAQPLLVVEPPKALPDAAGGPADQKTR